MSPKPLPTFIIGSSADHCPNHNNIPAATVSEDAMLVHSSPLNS
jgi:hypothetical protein